MNILGINAAFHDSSACLLIDGKVVAAAEEERFTRIKHHKRPRPFQSHALPFRAMHYCLGAGGLTLGDVDHVAYAFDPFPLVQRAGNAPVLRLPQTESEAGQGRGFDPWTSVFLAGITGAPLLLAEDLPWELQDRLSGPPPPFRFVPHHVAHAASAYHPSPYEDAAVLTLDGYGGDATTTYWHGTGAELRPLGGVDLPHSLGLMYENVTAFLGYQRSSDEYKVMSMAASGRPVYLDAFREAIRLDGNGCYRTDLRALEGRLGAPRRRGEPLEQRHFDVAASLQEALEEAVLQLAAWLHAATGADALCAAGGVALNCKLNGRLRVDGPFRRMWVQPAAGDAGTALGAALHLHAELGGGRAWRMDHAYLGPGASDGEIETVLRRAGVAYRRMDDVAGETAAVLADEKLIGWFQGRMEFGPRALGARSILASPRHAGTRDRLNAVKSREAYQPVAPMVPLESASEWFVEGDDSPYMLFVGRVREDRQHQIPAVRHGDGTARVQTVRREINPRLHGLLRAFEARTGVPVLANTSFNLREEPVVCTPSDALRTYFTSPLDALVLGSFLLEKPAPTVQS
ncbi:carbamoyltransferase [Longimicrobium terrae]|uniref:Carbamoyltransferase n=1 Tax=Longimicrobium terrae TaxID=1639882 RepID=A0A841H7D5_9BACT|nr:carbamoyltransferase C-terminal domain-containing protein [Longimicrobium terrae]MBB4639440.1 carbamoyltransferase [Longimicrobium terrae]MBB6073812.1 carbamoyltransferase [Longimicrobium terrae]NNC33200.1 carbamoyltransferase [Longimicrobium terrae]